MKNALAVAALVLVAGCGSASPKNTLTGTVTLTTASLYRGAAPGCSGKGGFEDINGHTQVTVSDDDGKLLATGTLGEGALQAGSRVVCVFPIVMTDTIPKKAFYKVEVGKRGALSYSWDDMQAAGWKVGLTLG